MRRPAPPQLRAGRPGAPAAPAAAPTPPPVAAAPLPTPTAPTPATPTPAAPVAPGPGGTGRRAVLLVGAAAVVGGAVSAGALLRGDADAAPSAASLGVPPGSGDAAPFADVAADDPGAEAMRWADETGVQPALSGTDYSPQAEVSRGDAAVALHRLAGAPAVELGDLPVPFTDLGDDPVRVAALLWLHGRGALWGDAELRVRPDDAATRDCTAMMLAALMRPALAGVGVTWDASAEVSVPQAEGPGSALADAAWLDAAGITSATLSLADWSGDEVITRADLAMSLHRADAVITAALD